MRDIFFRSVFFPFQVKMKFRSLCLLWEYVCEWSLHACFWGATYMRVSNNPFIYFILRSPAKQCSSAVCVKMLKTLCVKCSCIYGWLKIKPKLCFSVFELCIALGWLIVLQGMRLLTGRVICSCLSAIICGVVVDVWFMGLGCMREVFFVSIFLSCLVFVVLVGSQWK